MALTVGTDSYITVSEADAYFLSHGTPAEWDVAELDAKEAALRYATQWLDATYSWIGYLADPTQVLGWPRYSAYDQDQRLYSGIPDRIKWATAEMALSHIKDGALNKVQYVQDGRIASVQAGSVAVSYREEGGLATGGHYDYVAKLVSPLAGSGASTKQIVRS